MYRYLYLLLGALTFGTPATAAESLAPLNFKGVYEFRLAGLLFGKLGIEVKESKKAHSIICDIKSSGVANIFTNHTSHTIVKGSGSAYPNINYRSDYQTKKKKSVSLTYRGGEITKEILVPPDNRATRPAVAGHLKNAAYDPLTLNVALRKAVWNALQTKKNDFKLTVYDGRRLTEINGSIEATRTVKDESGQKIPVVAIGIRRKLLGGYTQSEIADYDPKEPLLKIYYSNDARFVPIKAEIPFIFGTMVGTLAKTCEANESCLLGVSVN